VIANPNVARLEKALDAWDARAVRDDEGPRAAAVLAAATACFLPPAGGLAPDAQPLGHRFLEATGGPAFLRALGGPEPRGRWAEVACAAIRASAYSLETMLAQRAATLGNRPLFEEYGRNLPGGWSYARVLDRARAFAAAFLSADAGGAPPRVALYVDNSVDGACCDLACLLHDILVAPLNIHFGADELAWILDRLAITIVVTDDEERLRRLLEVQRRASRPFTVFALRPNRIVDRGDARLLGEAVARLTPARVEAILAARPRRGLDEVSTVMFTSGSTGRPKGVLFTPFNLVTKRFARAAALPDVGDDEVLLCYLPLFHTFGRYLEMLGTIFWRGTYVFAGNPSAETLVAALRQVRPTGLISIPLRWTQLRDRTLEAMETAGSKAEREAAFRDVVGDRLRWGLSAAGYLEPKVFQHFNHFGVSLCSGFGMTEATGGITMSPPGDYLPGSVGIPLPAIRVRLTPEGEMRIAGPYVARHLADEGERLVGEPGIAEDGEEWIPTGDLFRELERGHLTIVDRLKDIYKNDRGQTVAPQRVERKFLGVPGIRRTFLVGDHRSYNVLLIVPDPDDPVLLGAPGDDASCDEYFERIVAAANENLAPYERVVNFALLYRDFDLEHGELTPKGSYHRKAIERNFADVIDALYQRPWVELAVGDLRVRIPRWFHRDLGILEQDLRADSGGLVDRRRGLTLPLRHEPGEDCIRIGDLAYRLPDAPIDLGGFARQPRLWMGNPALIRFAPCKDGWDAPLAGLADGVRLPPAGGQAPDRTARPHGMRDPRITEINDLLQAALFAPVEEALAALDALSRELTQSDDHLSAVIRSRVAALAWHPDEGVRCLAYRILLLDEPMPGYEVVFPSFIESGLSFLDQDSIAAIALARFEQRRLQLLRRRLLGYRARLPWPAPAHTREQFRQVLSLLASFARRHPDYYKPIRAELTCWVLHRDDPTLAAYAQTLLDELGAWFEARLERAAGLGDRDRLCAGLQFDEDVPAGDRERIRQLLFETGFLRESVMLTFDVQDFDLGEIADDGLWVSRIQSRGAYQLYRLSVNTRRQRHFDLLVILRGDMDADAVALTNHWMVAIGEHPQGDRTLPRFGCVRPDLAAMSLEYVREPTVAERIRVLAAAEGPRVRLAEERPWRKLYVRALAVFFRAWEDSARRIVPGSIDPANVSVPDFDYHEGALILSLAGWEPYRNALSLVRPMCRTFYRKVRTLYPSRAGVLRFEWMFEACVEALGAVPALAFLTRLAAEARADADPIDPDLLASLDGFLADFARRYHAPLALLHAIDRYREWSADNPEATDEARAQQLDQLVDLYRLERFGEIARYHLYRHTCFAEAPAPAREAFDRLLDVLRLDPARPATERLELSDLQAALVEQGQRDLFSRLVFPRAHGAQRIEVLTFCDSAHPLVRVRTHVADERGETYDVREPVEPDEVGQLYRLFFQERFPKPVNELDRHLIVTDATGRLVAGLTYRMENPRVAHLDGVVVNAAVGSRGIATALLEDFAVRMASRGVSVLRTSFIMREFCEQRGFRLDRRWGGLVRMLAEEGGGPRGA
jgi:long-chain acyl-CoA synthetase